MKIGLLKPEDAQILHPQAGRMLVNGPQARLYADNYVLAHMRKAAEMAGVSEDRATYAGVGDLATES